VGVGNRQRYNVVCSVSIYKSRSEEIVATKEEAERLLESLQDEVRAMVDIEKELRVHVTKNNYLKAGDFVRVNHNGKPCIARIIRLREYTYRGTKYNLTLDAAGTILKVKCGLRIPNNIVLEWLCDGKLSNYCNECENRFYCMTSKR